MNRIRVGVIGVGHLGREHARIYAALPDCVLTGVADIHEGRGRDIATRHGVPLFARPEDLLGQVDAVSVAVPTRAHFEVAKPFLERGIPCLVEKPITATIEEADAMVALARSRGAILQIGHVERFNPAVQAYFRDFRIVPRFIEAQRISPYPFRSTDVGVVLDLMIHDLDIVLSFVRSPLARVSAVGLPVLSNKVDIANARLEFENGAVANLTASRVSLGDAVRKIKIFQHESYISIDYQAQKMAVFTLGPGDPLNPMSRIRVEEVSLDRQDALAEEIRSFVDCVRTRSAPPVSGEEGRRALAVALQVLERIERTPRPEDLY